MHDRLLKFMKLLVGSVVDVHDTAGYDS